MYANDLRSIKNYDYCNIGIFYYCIKIGHYQRELKFTCGRNNCENDNLIGLTKNVNMTI